MQYIPAMGCYLALKRKEALSLSTRGRNLGYIMLNDRSQAQKTMRCVIPFTGNA